LSAEGDILNPERADAIAAREAETADMLKRIRAYVKGYMAEFRAGMAAPSGGDCWLCLLRETATGKAWGDMDETHLIEHMRERYYVPSLAVNALSERGLRPEGMGYVLGVSADGSRIGGTRNEAEPNGIPDSVSRALTRYLKKRLVAVAS